MKMISKFADSNKKSRKEGLAVIFCNYVGLHRTPKIAVWSRVAIWPFLKQFDRNKMIWPFGHLAIFWPFLDLDKNKIFLAYFGKNSTKHTSFYDVPKFIYYILVNFL
jgi:hypothetical protein